MTSKITPSTTVAIKEIATGKYITQAALELWEDGHCLDGVDLWTDEVQMAAWITPDDAPAGMDGRFALVDVYAEMERK